LRGAFSQERVQTLAQGRGALGRGRRQLTGRHAPLYATAVARRPCVVFWRLDHARAIRYET
jgi:hypothetical protein